MIERKPLPDWPDAIYLDEDHAYAFFKDGQDPWGAIVWHRAQDGGWCGGVIFFRETEDEHPIWELVSKKPLTVKPSVKCACLRNGNRDDGMAHGFITDGKWVPALKKMPEWARDLGQDDE
jgi:hypothetical protein